MAIQAIYYHYIMKYTCEQDSHGTTERDFIEYHNFRAIGYTKDLLGLPGAVQPTIADGVVNVVPAFGGDKSRWILWTVMPDTNQPGVPISLEDFESDWVQQKTTPTNVPHKDLLHHLIQSHAGELRALGTGNWKRCEGRPCEALFHWQYAMSSQERAEMHSYKRWCDDHGRGRGKGSAFGGKGGKGKGKGPASGGKGDSEAPMWSRYGKPNFENRILRIHDEGSFDVWEGVVISLPRLFHCLGFAFTAADLYAFWHTLNIIATHRPHSWATEARQGASRERYRRWGKYGHSRCA